MFIERNNGFLLRCSIIVVAPLILYWQDLTLLANEALNNEASSHIVAVPLLVGYVLYRIRRVIIASALHNPVNLTAKIKININLLSGILLCLMAYLLRWIGSYTFYPLEIHLISFPIFISGIILIIFNFSTLTALIFPVLYLFLIVPPPFEYLQLVGSTLSIFGSQAAYRILQIFKLPVGFFFDIYHVPYITITPIAGETISFGIDLACSGIYSLIGYVMFAIFAAYISRGPFKKKMFILILGIPIIYTLNIIRIMLIVLIGYFSGPNLYLNVFHFFGGWVLVFLGTLIIVFVAERGLNISFFSQIKNECSHHNVDESAGYCINCGQLLKYPDNVFTKDDRKKIILLFALVITFLMIQVPVFTLTEGSAEVFTQKSTGEYAVANILPDIEGYDVAFLERDGYFENISGQDASLWFVYQPKEGYASNIWVGLEVGPTKGCLHPWEVCYITWPQSQGRTPNVEQLDLREVHLIKNPPLSARYFVLNRPIPDFGYNQTEVYLYWYVRSIFQTLEGPQVKWVKISLIEYADTPDRFPFIEAELLPIAIKIAEYWKPISEWSWVSLLLAKNGLHIITVFGMFLLGSFFINRFYINRERKSAKIRYNHLINSDRQILDSIKALQYEVASLEKIALKYRELTGNDIDLETLQSKLMKTEKEGLIKRKIVGVNDYPYLSWTAIY